MATTTDTPVLTKEIRIKASPATVHSFLVDPEKLVRWMGHEAKLEARPGGAIEVNYNGFDIMRGEYVEISPERVVMTWGWEDNPMLGPGESTVTFELEAVSEGTLLRLIHTGLPVEMQPSFSEGWDHFTGRLAAVVEGRDAGPDPWAPRKAELIAGEVRRLARRARAAVEAAPAEHLQRKSAIEGWTAAALGMHVVAHLGLVQFVEDCINGKTEMLSNLTLEDLEAKNRESSATNAEATKEEILAAYDAQVDGAVERLRAIQDEDLARSAPAKFTPSGRVTAEELAQGPLLANMREHVASLQATLA